jgi:hypothetical protein
MVSHPFAVAALIGFVSLLYATAGQAGGTAFIAVMAFAAFPATEMRATALLLNIVAAGYATWQVHRRAAIDRKVLLPLTVPSLVAAFLGGLLAIGGHAYFHPDRPVVGRGRCADGVQAGGRHSRSPPGSTRASRRRGGRSGVHLGTYRRGWGGCF